ncbi:hypothetical protein [Paenibacillus polymyxa]|jgi:hypothetical protein|uniref:hypothetical protein n=1 Tax=Paenibacillus polymyxa TaxID=1406 RepID=UPI00083D801F|nr:hypothetical protein [Paenibacillus polymyxa]ODB61379.1 hypothetical protein A7309_15140 [Paenibacillus polymyxa]
MNQTEITATKKMPYWINNNRVSLVGSSILCEKGKTKDVPVIITEKGAIIEDLFWIITSDPNNKALGLCQKMPKEISTNKWDFKHWEITFSNNSNSDITFDLYVQILQQAGMVDVEII